MSGAQADVNGDKKDAAHTDAVQNEHVADTKAEGDHKVALARCESFSGDAHKSCKDQAEPWRAGYRAPAGALRVRSRESAK
jgi:hypothetical protein